MRILLSDSIEYYNRSLKSGPDAHSKMSHPQGFVNIRKLAHIRMDFAGIMQTVGIKGGCAGFTYVHPLELGEYHLTKKETDKEEHHRKFDMKRSQRLHWIRHHVEQKKEDRMLYFSVCEARGKRTYILIWMNAMWLF